MDEQVKILLAAQDQISKVLDSVEGKLDQVVSVGVEAQKTLQKVFDKKLDAVNKQTAALKTQLKAIQTSAKVTNAELKAALAKKNAAVLAQVRNLRSTVFNVRKESREADTELRKMFKAKSGAMLKQIRDLRQELKKLKQEGTGGIFAGGAGGLAGGILGRGTGLMAGYGLGRAFGIYGGLAGAIYSVQRGMAESIRTTAEYRTAMQYAAAVANSTRQQTEQLNGVIRELGALTEFTASQVADGARFLAQAGFEFQEVLQALPGMLELAAAGSMDLGQAADIVTNILRGFNLEVQRLNEVSDVLAHVASTSNTNIVQMGHAFSYAAPTARAAGEDFHEVAAALAILADAGIRGERAGTSLRQAYIRLQSMPESVAKEFEKLGIRIRSTADGTVDLSDVIDQLAEKNVELPGIFQARALAAMQQLVLNADRLKRLELDVLLDSIGRTSQIAEQKLEGMPRLVRELASAWEDLKLDIGESDFATKLVEDLRDVVRWLANVEDPVEDINKSLDLFANEFENRLDLVGPRVDDLVNRIETLNRRLVELGEKKRHVFGIASSFPGPEGFGPADPLSSSFTASQAEEAFRRWEAMRNRARDREREDDDERRDAEQDRIDRLQEIAQRYNAMRSAEKAAVNELVRLWAERDLAEAEAVKEHWEQLDERLELYQRVSDVMQRDLHRFHTVGIPTFEGPVPDLTGGPDANAGLKEAEKLWESNTDKLRQFQQVVQLTRQVTDDLAQRFLAATAQMIQGWLYMTAAIKSAETASVILAVIGMILSLVNALKGLGATSKKIVESNKALVSSLGDVRSGALTTAEAIDRSMKWKGNEEGHQFLLQIIDDFETIGRTAAEAEDIVGRYWDAMQRGDEGEMERIGSELLVVAGAATEVRDRTEEAGEAAEEFKKKFEDAFEGARNAVEEYLIATGVLSENWLDRQVNIAQDAAGQYGLAWDSIAESMGDLLESIAEDHGVSMDRILEDGIITADEFIEIWTALPEVIQAVFATALESMGFDLGEFLSNVSDSINSLDLNIDRERDRERDRLAREAERETERRIREAEREAERLARVIEQAIESGMRRVIGMLAQFQEAGSGASNEYLRGMLDMLYNPIWDRIGMTKEDFEGLIDAADTLGVSLADLVPDLNFAVMKEQVGNIGEMFIFLGDRGIEALSVVEKMSDEAVLAIGRLVDAAIAAGVPIDFIKEQFGGAYDALIDRYNELKGAGEEVEEAAEDVEEAVMSIAEAADILGLSIERLGSIGKTGLELLGEELDQLNEAFRVLAENGESVEDIISSMSDSAVMKWGPIILAAQQLGKALSEAEKSLLGLYAGLRLQEIDDRMTEIRENRILRSLDEQEKDLRDELDRINAVYDAEENRLRKLIEKSNDYYNRRIEIAKEDAKKEIEAINDRIEALKDELAERRKIWKEQEEAARDAAASEKERLDALAAAAKTAADAEKERLDALAAAAKTAADAEKERLDLLKERLELQRVDTDRAWEAAQAFGVRDRSELGTKYHQKFASERILELAEQVRLLQTTGLTDQSLSKMHVIQTRIARASQDITKFGLTLPENLKGIADLLGYTGLGVGTGKTPVENQLEQIAKTREQVEAELNEKLEQIAKTREQVEAELNEKLESIAQAREKVESDLKLTLERIADERERVEQDYQDRIDYLVSERERVEENLQELVERLESERDEAEKGYLAQIEAAAEERQAAEDEINAALEDIQAKREVIENARLAREIEREKIEEERLVKERKLLTMVQGMIDGSGGGSTSTSSSTRQWGPPAPDPRYPNFDPNDPWNKRLLDIYETIHEVQLHKERVLYGASKGSGGLMDFSSGTPVVLHKREAVVTEQSWMNAIERAAAGGRQNGQLQVVNFELDGLGFGRATMRWQTKAAHLEGVR